MKLDRTSHVDDLLILLAGLISGIYAAALLVAPEGRFAALAHAQPALAHAPAATATTLPPVLALATVREFESGLGLSSGSLQGY